MRYKKETYQLTLSRYQEPHDLAEEARLQRIEWIVDVKVGEDVV